MLRAGFWVMTQLDRPSTYISEIARKRPNLLDLDWVCFQAIPRRSRVETNEQGVGSLTDNRFFSANDNPCMNDWLT
jgi:hypothetical protein